MQADSELLRRYAEHRSQDAFAELVRRHLNLVYSVALRQVGGDSHLAEDVAQQVFAALARKAATLTNRPTLGGWLYRSAHFAASDVVRVERRRRAREQEVQTMEPGRILEPSPTTVTENAIAWERIRPALDAAIAELGERDRDAVSLRFFDGCSFADVGARLRLTENAARMRVDRALDKLHAALSRRGITSTAAALGMALANQGALGAPVGLAAAISGGALACPAAGASGILALIGTTKMAAGLGAGATAVALGVAVVQYNEKTDTAGALAAAERQRHSMRVELASANTRLAHAERRAAEAERDNGELLAAVQRAQDAARAAGSAPASGNSRSINPAVPVSSSPEQEERMLQERAHQQQLAKRRAQEAMARAKIESEAAAENEPAARYERFMAAAEHYAANDDFPAGIRAFNTAMTMKPAHLLVTDRSKELQATLFAQNAPVEIALISDGLTTVSVVGPYGHRIPSQLQSATVKVLPANYEVIGRRKGFQDVVIPVQVRNGAPQPVITVECTLPEK